MKKVAFGSLASLLLPFAAQGAHIAYGSYQRKSCIHQTDAQPLSVNALRVPVTARNHDLADAALTIATGAPVAELLIVDADVPDQALLRSAVRPGVETVVLQPGRDALVQIEEVLRGYHDLSAVHLVSHGEPGAILLGGHRIDAEVLQNKPGLLNALDAATQAGADLMLYACDVAASDEKLLEIVQQQSQLDVAASNDLTGAAELGGDWTLEIDVGDIESELAFSDKALKDFSAVLGPPFGTKTFEALTYELYTTDPSIDFGDFAAYIDSTLPEILGGINSGACIDDLYINMLYADSRFYIRADPSGQTFGVTELVLRKSNSYNTTAVDIAGFATIASTTPIATKNNIAIPGDQSPVTVDLTSGLDLGSFEEVAKIRLTPNDADLCIHSITFSPRDTDGNLAAAGGVAEPVALDSSIDSAGEAVDVFDFTLSDGGGSDGLSLDASQLVFHVSGSTTDGERGQITWRLNGADAVNVAGVYNAAADTITFSGLGISVADGGSETYTVNAYFNDNSNLVDGHTIGLLIDGDTDLVVDSSGTGMGATSPVSNGSGSPIQVMASQLVFSTQPSGSVSGIPLATQPVVAARDAAGNLDTDFTETVSLTEASAGTLSGNTQAASSGVATFASLTYTASADQESFTLSANDEDAVGSNLPTVDASAITSDVVATQLLFTQQPAPTSVPSGVPTAFTTVPVVSAVDANNTLDTGYATVITLAEANGAGSANMFAIGDSDGDSATVSLAPVNGVSTFFGLTISYGGTDTFNLRASASGLASDDSVQINAMANQAPTDISLSDNSVNQSGSSNAVVGTLTTTDPDTADTHSYSLVTGTGDTDNASFNINGDQLRANDAEALAAGTYSVRIQTTDSGGATYQETFTITVVDDVAPTVASVTVPTTGTYGEGDDLGFTVHLDEGVTVDTSGGMPRIPITLGSTTVYASYLGGSGTTSLTFHYVVQSGDEDGDGITVGAAIEANGGTLEDSAGNSLDTTLNAVGTTSGVLVDAVAPSGHSVTFDDDSINAAEASSASFSFTGAEVGASYTYSITSSGGGTPITGSGTIASASEQISGIDVSGLADGTLTLSVTLTDSAGNSAEAVTDTASLTSAVAAPMPVPANRPLALLLLLLGMLGVGGLVTHRRGGP